MADLDHRYMTPPSLRVTEQRQTPSGDWTYVWDLRIAQPNVSQIAMPVVHSLEHFLGTLMREASRQVVAVAPMGCQTGFYIVTIGIGDVEEIAELLASALLAVGDADAVPVANALQCGWAENHSLAGVQELAAWLLRRRSEWHEPGADAREVG
jgi:S-ribosylhomocysteine lyase